jgi:hypothetical protein
MIEIWQSSVLPTYANHMNKGISKQSIWVAG